MWKKSLSTLAIVVVALATACADPTEPTRTLVPVGPTLDVLTPTPAWPFPIADGAVELCKTSNVGGSFDFDATGPAGLDTDPDITIPPGGGTVCALIYTSWLGNAGGAETVVITETANAVPLTNIDIIQYLDEHMVSDNDYIPGVHLNDSESEITRTATVKINHDMARRVVFTNTATVVGGLGCTPGYWKQSHHFDSWPPAYAPTDGFNATFGLGTNWFNNSLTLVGAASQGGGGFKALSRHAVAALLNAASGFAGYTEAQVKAAVLAAYNNPALINSTHLAFEDYNEQRCPLN